MRVAESPHYQITIRAFDPYPAVTSADTFAERFHIPAPFLAPKEVPTRVLFGLPPGSVAPTVAPPATDGSVTVRWSFTLGSGAEVFDITTSTTLAPGDNHAVEQTVFKRVAIAADGYAACRVARALVTPAGLSLPPALQFSTLKAHNHCGWVVGTGDKSEGSFVALASAPLSGPDWSPLQVHKQSSDCL